MRTASAADAVAGVAITATCWRTRLATSAVTRDQICPSQWYSTVIGRRSRPPRLKMTHERQWLCTAAMILMPVQPLSMYSFEPIRCFVN